MSKDWTNRRISGGFHTYQSHCMCYQHKSCLQARQKNKIHCLNSHKNRKTLRTVSANILASKSPPHPNLTGFASSLDGAVRKAPNEDFDYLNPSVHYCRTIHGSNIKCQGSAYLFYLARKVMLNINSTFL